MLSRGRKVFLAFIQMNAYNLFVPPNEDPTTPSLYAPGAAASSRWELYRLLADPVRPRLLALVSVEELGVGELADLLRESQPKISRHAAALRDAGLVAGRKQGTWMLLRLAHGASEDAVVADAVAAGLTSCHADGTLARVDEVIAARDEATLEFFARGGRPVKTGPPHELGAYLAALAPLLPYRRLAVDVGTGEGPLLEVLAPLFEKVIAVDRSDAQLALAAERVRRRELHNVTLVRSEIDGPEVRTALHEALQHPHREDPAGGHKPRPTGRAHARGADVVFASRILHHAPIPARALRALVDLARPPSGGAPGGAVCILDYEAHDDQALREQQADLWLGFEPRELKRLARDAGLIDVTWQRLPAAWQGEGPDRHLAWQLLVGKRGTE
jgi:DNA-binding transcriptional ArsR family regulator